VFKGCTAYDELALTEKKRKGLAMAQTALSRIKEYAELVKFEHTVFALPFALSAMLLACPIGQWPAPWTVMMIVLAMVGGRTFAMALNRLIDADIDAQNPRTQNRGIPAGRVQKVEATFLALASAALLTVATLQLPTICQALLPVAFGILMLYSYMKRFSSLAHLVLGVALGSSAVGGWLAVSGVFSSLPVVLGFAVVFWVAGFDIIYACQDETFDRQAGLFSIPSQWGVPSALTISKGCHLITVVLMVAFSVGYTVFQNQWMPGLYMATAVMAGFLVYEHRLVSPTNLDNVNEAFFVVNGRISLSIFAFVLLDKVLQVI